MPFAWVYLDDEGREAGRSDAFAHREDAEEWLGTAWEGLLERGYEQVDLVDVETGSVGYRMGLRPAD